MSQPLRETAVVGQNEKTFCLRIESADVEEPRKFCGEKIEDRVARIWIVFRRNKTRGLVQNDVQWPLGAHKFAIHFHVVVLGWLRAEIHAALSVDADSTLRDQLIAVPARTNAGRSEETIQAHRRAGKQWIQRPTRRRTILNVRLGFRKANDFSTFLPLPALLQQFHALEALQDVAPGGDGAGAF